MQTTAHTYSTPNAQDIALAMDEIERIGFEPCAVLKSNRVGEGLLPNGTAVGFRWISGARFGVEGHVESWSVWTWCRLESGTVSLNGLSYDIIERDAAFSRAAERCDHDWSPATGSVAG